MTGWESRNSIIQDLKCSAKVSFRYIYLKKSIWYLVTVWYVEININNIKWSIDKWNMTEWESRNSIIQVFKCTAKVSFRHIYLKKSIWYLVTVLYIEININNIEWSIDKWNMTEWESRNSINQVLKCTAKVSFGDVYLKKEYLVFSHCLI